MALLDIGPGEEAQEAQIQFLTRSEAFSALEKIVAALVAAKGSKKRQRDGNLNSNNDSNSDAFPLPSWFNRKKRPRIADAAPPESTQSTKKKLVDEGPPPFPHPDSGTTGPGSSQSDYNNFTGVGLRRDGLLSTSGNSNLSRMNQKPRFPSFYAYEKDVLARLEVRIRDAG